MVTFGTSFIFNSPEKRESSIVGRSIIRIFIVTVEANTIIIYPQGFGLAVENTAIDEGQSALHVQKYVSCFAPAETLLQCRFSTADAGASFMFTERGSALARK